MWWKYWGKRVITFPRLLQSITVQQLLKLRGAEIEDPIFIASCKLNGDARNLKIGRGTFIGRVTVNLHDRIDIGRNVVINDGAILFTASHDVMSESFATTTAAVEIGDYAWIASGVLILPGTKIGSGAVIGAGAVVRMNIPDYKIAIGNPAKIVDGERARNLRYQPARKVATFEAWLGREDRAI